MGKKLTLTNDEISFFYRLLYRYETTIKKNPKGYNIDAKEVKQFTKDHSLELDYGSKTVTKHNIKNKMTFTKGKSACVSLFRHIRNAFAHATISKVNDCYIIQDDKRMYGKIETTLLPKLIDVLEQTKKNK